MRRALFFIEEETLHSFWIALKSNRPIFQMRQQRRRNANIIIDYLSLCEPDFRVQDFFEVGHSQLLSANYDFNFFTHYAARLFVRFACRLRGYTRLMKRIFILSPAHA